MIVVGNQLWTRCGDCGSFVRINKPILGSLHICLTDEEIAAKRGEYRQPPQAEKRGFLRTLCAFIHRRD